MTALVIKPLRNRVIVKMEGTEHGKLSEHVSEGGIVIGGASMAAGSFSEDGLADRWAEIIAVGPEVYHVNVGERVMIENGKWTEAIKLPNGEHVWMTEEEFIMAVDDKA